MSSNGEDIQVTDPVIAIVAISLCGTIILICIISIICTTNCNLVKCNMGCRKETQSTLEQSTPMIQHP